MSAPQRKWTDEEMEALLNYLAQGLSYPAIGKLMNRNPGSIEGKVQYIGLTGEQKAQRAAACRQRRMGTRRINVASKNGNAEILWRVFRDKSAERWRAPNVLGQL